MGELLTGLAALLGVMVSVIALILTHRTGQRAQALETAKTTAERELARRKLDQARQQADFQHRLDMIDQQLETYRELNQQLRIEVDTQKALRLDDVTRLEKRIDDLLAERSQLLGALAAMQEQLTTIRQEKDAKIERLDVRVLELERQVAQLSAELETERAKNQRLEEGLASRVTTGPLTPDAISDRIP
jgi:predicted  nucleic acid-binding Zn-ribbon protein